MRLAALFALSCCLACDSRTPMEKLRADVQTAAASGKPTEGMAAAARRLFDGYAQECVYTADEKTLTVSCKRTSSETQMNTRQLREWTGELTAKHTWRLFRELEKRGLREITVSLQLPVRKGKADQLIDLYRVHVTAEQLHALSGWDTLDPYHTRSPSLDLSQGPELDFINRLAAAWDVQIDNRSSVVVRP